MPDDASYLVFRPDENGHYSDTSSEIWSGAKPEAGNHVPHGCLVVAWVPVMGDVNPLNYRRNNFALIHQP